MNTSVFRSCPARLFAALACGLSLLLTLGAAAPGASLDSAITSIPGFLSAVSFSSASEGWAVGFQCAASCRRGSEVDHALILHWNGTVWVKSASPNPNNNSKLNGIAALSASNVWAVGSYCAAGCSTASPVSHALILHWNGATWKPLDSPNPSGSLVTTLNGVSAESHAGAWAVGTYCSANCYLATSTPQRLETLALRWDGSKWRQVPSPDPGGRYGSSLYGVSVLSTGSAWAVGNYATKKSYENFSPGNSLVLHWNGTAWVQQRSPSFGQPAPGSVLSGVSAISSSSALAAGSSYYYNCECVRTLALRWNGAMWTRVPSPNPNPSLSEDQLFGISAVSPSDAWAVGYWESNVNYETLVEHWNGTGWSKVPSPNSSIGLKGNGNILNGVSGLSSTDAWAVGYYSTGTYSYTVLILHWNGSQWVRS